MYEEKQLKLELDSPKLENDEKPKIKFITDTTKVKN